MNASRAMQNLDGQKHVLLFWYKNMQRRERRWFNNHLLARDIIREVSEEKTENEDLSECGMKWTAVWLKQTHQLFGVSWN